MSFGKVGSSFVVAHGKHDPSDHEWSQFVSELSSSAGEVRRLIVYSGGASINSRQREQVVKIFRDARLRGIVLTDSAIVRGAVTAIAWFGVSIAAFKPDDANLALAQVDVPRAEQRAVLEFLEQAKAQVSEPKVAV